MAVDYNTVNGWYNQYLGRSASQDEYNNWINGTYGSTDPAGIQSQIQNSGEAQAYSSSRQQKQQSAPALPRATDPGSDPSQINNPSYGNPSSSVNSAPGGATTPGPTLTPNTNNPLVNQPTGTPGTYGIGSPNDPNNASYNPQTFGLALVNSNPTLQGGSGQGIVDAINQRFGLQTGNSAAWRSIPDAPGGGVIELPGGGYLAPGPDGQWGYNAGDSGGNGGNGGTTSGGVGPGGTGGFADPAYNALNTLANNLINKLNTPQSFPQLDQLQSMLQAQEQQSQQLAQAYVTNTLDPRIAQLQQPLLSQAQVVQQHAQASNQLIAQRDQDIQNIQQSFASRGISPTSGLALDQIRQIQDRYSNQQAQIDAQLQQANISTDEQRRNEATQLGGLAQQALQGASITGLQEQAQAADLENQLYNIGNQRNLEQLQVAQIPVDLTNAGYANAVGAQGNPSGDLSSLMSLIQLGLQGQGQAFGQSNSQMSGIMSLIMNSLGGLG